MTSIYDISVSTIDGTPQKLADYKGNVMLVVNVASKCGLTPQYEELEKLYEQNQHNGLVVLGFPSNEFAGQEPGAEAEIQDFCRSTYGVQFPMFSKICVNGEQRHDLYQTMIKAQPKAEAIADSPLRAKLSEHGLLTGSDSDVTWNFEKFLINRNGDVVGRFDPDITVENPILSEAIAKELSA